MNDEAPRPSGPERGAAGARCGRRTTRAERRAGRAVIEDPSVVLAAAARLLEARARSVHETRRRLLEAGYREPLVDGAIARLLDIGILNDEAFARAWVASRERAHPRGERALRTELALKGIDRTVVDAVLGERAAAAGAVREGEGSDGRSDEPSADERAATRLLERRRSTLERVDDPRVRRQRAYALLARAGFDPDTAARVAGCFVRGEDE